VAGSMTWPRTAWTVEQILSIFDNYGFTTEVIVPACATPCTSSSGHAGRRHATIPFGVIGQLAKHPLTDIGIEKFLADWKKVRSKQGP